MLLFDQKRTNEPICEGVLRMEKVANEVERAVKMIRQTRPLWDDTDFLAIFSGLTAQALGSLDDSNESVDSVVVDGVFGCDSSQST